MKHHAHIEETTFLQRTGAGAKRHMATIIITTVMSAVTGTIVPMVEQWHSDKQTADAIAEVKADLVKKLDTDDQKFNALFQTVSNLRVALATKGVVVNSDVTPASSMILAKPSTKK